MALTSEYRRWLAAGAYDALLQRLYVTRDAARQRARLTALLEGYEARFGETEVMLFSAPGRTEIGGNHTDHQHGCVLAASINLDTVACAAPNGTDVIRIQSEGYPFVEVSVGALAPDPAEKNQTAALVRGMAAAVAAKGYAPRGFDAYVVSSVLGGSGLSSSAAYETLIGVILNHLFCNGELDAVEIAKFGQYAENVFFGKPCGLMDQMASSVGNVVAIDFNDPANPKIDEIAFPFADCGHALCIIDSGADHADLTDEYAAVPQEMRAVAAHFGKEVLRDVDEAQFFAGMADARRACGDRAVLRAAHFFADNRRAQQQADALRAGDFDRFCRLVTESGRSSFMYLQNVYTSQSSARQAVAVALLTAERLLQGRGAFRVHGGGFAGTIQAFVPDDLLDTFRTGVESVLGKGSCHVLGIRPAGGIVLLDGDCGKPV